jgi:hypothetical protein
LYAFKGFFDVGIREHDFAQGVADALDVWQRVKKREGNQVLKLPNQVLPPVPPAPVVDDVQLARVKQRMEVMIAAAINGLPFAEKLWVKAMLEWQIDLFLGSFLQSLG